MNRRPLLAVALALTLATAGCLNPLGDDPAGDAEQADAGDDADRVDVSGRTEEDIQQRTQEDPTNYTVPGQQEMETETVVIEGTVGPESNTAHESKNDRSGNDANTYVVAEDVSDHIPPGQPTEVHMKLRYQNSPGSSADLDLYVDVPGAETDYAPDNDDEWNWKQSVQKKTVNTVGVDGEDHEVGVEVTNGKMVQSLDYTLNVTFRYAQDVVTPYHPYTIQVPSNASGLVFESEKAGGGEHIRSEFMLVGPDDNLVGYQEYNDLAIETESVLVPVSKPGEYVFYAPEMRGGFLSVSADAPPEDREVGTLERKTARTVDIEGPAPGMIEWNPTRGCDNLGDCDADTSTPMSGGEQVSFTVEESFPLEVRAFVGADSSFEGSAGTQVRITAGDDLVHEYKRWMRADHEDDQMGLSRDELNTRSEPGNYTRDQFDVHIVNNGPNAVGHEILTYVRE